jgi:Tfp pilus assembly protein PilN
MRAQRAAGLATLRDIEQRSARSDSSFSNLLVGLARQDLAGIWLERIEFRDAGESISIEGRALEASDVPRFLRALGREPSFGDRRFRRFEMDRDDPAAHGIGFRVATQAETSTTRRDDG